MQHEGIEVRSVGPHNGPQPVVHANLRKEVGIDKWLKDGAMRPAVSSGRASLDPLDPAPALSFAAVLYSRCAKYCRLLGAIVAGRVVRFAGWSLVPVVLVLIALWATPAFGATEVMLYAVPSGGDTTVGSSDCQVGQPACALSLALHQSNDGSLNNDDVVISLAAGTYSDSVYNVNQGQPSTLVFDGAGSASTIMDGGGTKPVFTIGRDFPVKIENMTLENGGGNGADVLQAGDEETVLDEVLVNGGPAADEALLSATSGGLVLDDSTIEHIPEFVTGIDGDGGEITVEHSTISGIENSLLSLSAGVRVAGASGALIDESTVNGEADALVAESTGSVAVVFSTFSDNSFDIVLGTPVASEVTVGASILADECDTNGAAINDGAYNVVAGSTCFSDTSGKSSIDKGAGAIGLGSLAWNGGPTQTVAISSSSDARDFAPSGICEPTDQRGIVRPQPGSSDCDVGAYQYAPPTLISASPGSGLAGSSVTLTGTNLVGVTGVTVAGAAATITAQSNTSITLTVPPVAPGATSIVAHGTDGSPSLAFNVTVPSAPPAPVLTPTSTTPAPALTPTSTTQTPVAKPAIKLSGFSVNKHKGTATVKLSCAGAPCRGELALSVTLHTKVKLHGHEVTKKVVILLGTHSYDLAAGASDETTIALDRTGRKDVKQASRSHPLSLSLSASTSEAGIVTLRSTLI